MKKIYLAVILMVISVMASAQVALPYSYDFSGYFSETGWVFQNNDENCLMNNVLSGQQSNELWFISGYDFCGEQYRQYLLSPRIVNSTTDSVQFRFRYIIPDNQNTTETFVIGYCTADLYSSVDDFVWLDDTVRCTRSDIWQSFQGNLPPTAQYVAIAYTSGMGYALKIDDILLRSDSPDTYYPFTVNANDGGTVAVTTGGQTTYGSVSVMEADDLTYVVTAEPGCYIGNLKLDNVVNYAAVNQSSFTQTISPYIAPHVLDVTFARYEYSIQIAETEHGSIVPDGGAFHQLIVPWDTTVGFHFYPDEGYHVSSVALTAGGVTTYYYDVVDTFTIYNIRRSYTLQVSFALSDYVITATAGEGGRITPSGDVEVQAFTSQQFLITADPGYVIDTIFVDSEAQELPHYSSYLFTFDEIVENHTITVTFFHQPYIVHYTHTPHGDVLATGGVSVGLDSLQVYYEDTVVFHFTAEEGYELSDLQLNGASVGVDDPYLLSHVTQNSLFHAVFAEQTFQVTTRVHGPGTVSPSSTLQTGYFDTVQMVVSPAACTQADSILLDGVALALTDTVVLTHLAGNHTLDAYFSTLYYTMASLPSDHGTIISPERVVCGGTAWLKLVPDHCYSVARFYLDGEDRSDLLQLSNDTVYAVVPMVMDSHTVSADFERRLFQVSVQTTDGGTVTPGSLADVVCDTAISFEVIPDECYYAASVTVNGVSAETMVQRFPCAESGFGDTLRFTISQIERNTVVTVDFQQFVFPLTLAAGEHGTMSAPENVGVTCGSDTTITITPDVCYQIETVVADGVDVTEQLPYMGTSAAYTFTNVHEAHTLSATFERQAYTVQIAEVTNGSILLAADTVVLCGNDLAVVVVPDVCYQIDSVWLDGTFINGLMEFHQNGNYLIGDSALFVLENVTENHTLAASFKPVVFTVSTTTSGNGTVVTDIPGNLVECGTPVTMTMVPDPCHSITGVYLNGRQITDYHVDENGVGTYVIAEAQSYINFFVEFERDRYMLSLAQPMQHGQIDFLPNVRYCGDTVRLTYRSDDCYHLDSVMVGNLWIQVSDLSELNGDFVYEIQGIRSDLLLDAAFSVDSVHFVSNEGAPLSVTDTLLACGQSLTVYSVREDCKQLDSVRLNGTVYENPAMASEFMTLAGDTLFVHLSDLHTDCNLAVFYSHIQYEVRVQTSGRGHVSAPASQMVACGDSIAIAILPDDCQHLDHVLLQHAGYEIDNDTLLIIRNIHSDISLYFVFSSDQYEMITESNEYGTIEGTTGMVDCGSNLEYKFEPGDCAMLDSVFLDGVCVNDLLVNQTLSSLVIDSVSSDHHIVAVFKALPYMVEVETDEFTTMDVPSVNHVDCGSSFVLNVTTDTCHYITDILLDGISVGNVSGKPRAYCYVLTDVRQNHHLQVFSGRFSYSVATEFMDQFGHRLAASHTSIACGDDTTLYTAYPNDCYQLDSVYVNGEITEVQDSFFFENVCGDIEMQVYLQHLSYTVAVQEHPHCYISDEEMMQTRLCGSSVRVNFTPEEGYFISGLVVDGENVAVADHYDFTDLHADHLLSVYTERYHYQITAETNGHGQALPGQVEVSYGDTVALILSPDSCYQLEALYVDDQVVELTDTLWFESVVANHHVRADFARIQYAVEVMVAGNGSVSVPSVSRVDCGDDFVCRFTPDDCAAIGQLFVNEIPSSHLLQYADDYAELTLTGVDTDFVVKVEFVGINYTCSYSMNEGGVAALSEEIVYCGNSVDFSFTPNPCYYVASVLLNGQNIPLDQFVVQSNRWRYVIESVREDCHFDVRFEQYAYEVTADDGGAGTVYVSSDSVYCGGSVSFYVVPATCSRLSSVHLNGEDITARLTYRDNVDPWLPDTACYVVENITENQYITIEYAQEDARHIDVAFISGTSVLVRNDLSVDCGGDTTVSLTLDCYTLDSLLVDDVRVPEAETYTFNDVLTDHTVQAMFSQNSYDIVSEEGENGAIMPAGVSPVTCGGTASFTITPDQGYYIANLIVDGDTIAPAETYVFTDVRENHTIKPLFAIHYYLIDVEAGANGYVSPGDTIVPYGATVHYDIFPEDCYSVDSVVVNGENQGSLSSYDFVAVSAPQTLSAYFSQNVYSVDTEVSGLGMVTVSSPTVECGGSVLLNVAPEECYLLDSVLVNGENLGAVTTYTLSNIRENQYVEVYFSQITYQIVSAEMAHGSLFVPSSEVACGDEVTFTIDPDACYTVDSVIVNGVNVGAISAYHIDSMAENQYVEAYFSMLEFTVDVASGAHGSVSAGGSNVVTCGETFSLTIIPDECYQIGVVRVDGIWANSRLQGNVLVLEDVDESHHISVDFELTRHYQMATCNIGGTVSPGLVSALCGSDVTYEINPLNCYRVDTVWINGVALPNDSLTYNENVAHFTLHDIRQANNIVVRFVGVLYQFEVDNNGNGAVNLTQNSVDCDGSVTFSILPAQCERISSVVLNGNDITQNILYHANTNPLLPDTAFYTIDRMDQDQYLQIDYYQLSDNHLVVSYTDGNVLLHTDDTLLACAQTIVVPIGYDCYRVDSVLLNGVNVGTVSELSVGSTLSDQTVWVYVTRNRYEVQTQTNGNGAITFADGPQVFCGDDLSCEIIPNDCYQIDSVIVDGENRGAIPGFTFTNVVENHSLSAYFSRRYSSIMAVAGVGGSITPQGETAVLCGDDFTYSIVPDACHSIDSVIVNGINEGPVSSFTFENIVEDQMIVAYFSQKEFTVAATAHEGGQISPSGTLSVLCGEQQTFSIIPDDCSQIDSVVVNGVNVGAITSYTLNILEDIENQTIESYFSTMAYPISLVSGLGGSVYPSADTMVMCNGSLTVSVVPDECYSIASLAVDGINVGSSDSYTFENVRMSHTFSASFVLNEYTLTPTVHGGGMVYPNVTTAVDCGSDFTFTFVPNNGYYISGIVVDGDTMQAAESYTFSDIRNHHQIQPLFALHRYVIEAEASVGGSVTPQHSEVDYMGHQTITITADDCYNLDSVFVDGNYVGIYTTYTFNNVTADHTLTATFARDEYTVTASVEGSGTITPSGATTVGCGENATYSFAPETGWHYTGLLVDGVAVEATDTYTFENVREDHTITAQFAINEYTVTATAGDGGSVTPTDTTVAYGSSVIFEITAEDCQHVDSVFVDGEYVGAVNVYTFSNVADNHTLTATFASDEYIVTASVEGSGTITPSGATTVGCGENVTYSFAPETGWHYTGLLVDGVAVEATDTYTFEDIREDHTITAQFAINEYTVTATAGDGGSVNPTDTMVVYGSSMTVEITAEECHHIDSVFADGEYVGAVNLYTFSNVMENHTLTATFARDEYTVTASVEGSGTITPSGATTVVCGENVTYSFAPETGWHYTGLLVDGVAVEASDTYTFEDVRGNHTITAQFAINEYTVTATAGDGGSVSPTDTSVVYGGSVTVEITAGDCHHIDSVFADGEYVGAVNIYTFSNVADNHTLTATFARDEYTVTASVEGSGTITPSGTTTVVCGENVTYSFAPETGWHYTGLLVDGVAVEAADTYTFEDVRENHTITVQFAINEYTVTATAGDGGSITPTDTSVVYGGSVTVEIIAEECHHIDYVLVNGVNVGEVSSYEIQNISDNQIVEAFFEADVYDIFVSVNNEGEVLFFDTVHNVVCGSDTTVSIPLFDCYFIDSVMVNGELTDISDEVYITNIRENMNVDFFLSREQFTIEATQQGNGVVTPLGTVSVLCDEQATFTFTPEEGWYVQNLIVDGESLGTPTEDSYTFVNIHANHTLEVVFEPNVYIITSSIDPIDAGNITPYGQTFVNFGEDQTFNIMPFPGYQVVDVEVDGVSQGAITTYTFHHVDDNHTIVAHLLTVGVDENTVNEEVSVWPNPVENVCHIQLSDMHNAEIQLFDAQGKLILRKQADAEEVEIDFVGRPSGMYLLRVVSDGKVVTTRKVIRK